MAALSLKDTINTVMGLDRCVFMTQYFNAGEADIFIIVSNDVEGTYHLFYDGNGEIEVFKIGSKIALKRFISRSYSVDQSINYSNDFWGGLPLESHINAKRAALRIVRDTLASEAAALLVTQNQAQEEN